MKLDLLLVLGILLSTASQLRPAGAPIGPGEVCLVIWAALMLGREELKEHSILMDAYTRFGGTAIRRYEA